MTKRVRTDKEKATVKKPLKMVAPKEPGNVPMSEVDIIQKGAARGQTYVQIRDRVNENRKDNNRKVSTGKKGMFNLISRVISNKAGMVDKAEEKWEVYGEKKKQFDTLIESTKQVKDPLKRAKRERSTSLIWNKPKGRQTELVATYDAETDDVVLCTPPC